MADRQAHDENLGDSPRRVEEDDLHSLTDLIDEIEREAFARSLSRRPTTPHEEPARADD